MKDYQKILPYIRKGKENAVCRRKLADVLNTPPREVSAIVLSARLDGIIIASDNNGYYYPDTNEELEAYYRMHRKRAVMELASLKASRKELVRRGIKPYKSKEC